MDEPRRVVLAGATGTIGRAVARLCIEQGYALTVLSRDPDAARETTPDAAQYVRWQVEPPTADMPWVRAVKGAYAVINCAGESLFERRLTHRYEDRAQFTRVHATLALVRAMQMAGAERPAVFINSSSQGYYGFQRQRTDELVTEDTPPGSDDWAKNNVAWEAEAAPAATLGIRTVLMRTGYVLGPDANGGLAQQIRQFRRGRGVVTTPTDAWMSWIHLEDEARLYLFALADARVAGPLNGTAPEPATKLEYAQLLGLATMGQPVTRVVPGFVLRLIMGKAADIFNRGRRVIPQKALALGFQFHYATLETALADLVPRIAGQSTASASPKPTA
jgi:uncharacterized protein